MAKRLPLRRCVGCGEIKEKRELTRVVRSPEGEYRLDETGRGSGRGAYLCRSEGCLGKAIRRKGLEKSFHASVPREVYDALREEYRARYGG